MNDFRARVPTAEILHQIPDLLVKGDLRRRCDNPFYVRVDALQGAQIHLILNRHISIFVRPRSL